MPLAWLHSSGPNTGKTEAARIVHSLVGLSHVALWGGDPTKPALFDKLAQMADMLLVIDDYVVDPNNPNCKWMSTFFRSVFDHMTRAVSGKTRTPQSTALFTSNGVINEKDAAFHSRCLTFNFDKLQSGDDDPTLYSQWQLGLKLLSACTPDFETMLHNGKLDSAAIQDCAQFVQRIIGRKRDRQANMCAALAQHHAKQHRPAHRRTRRRRADRPLLHCTRSIETSHTIEGHIRAHAYHCACGQSRNRPRAKSWQRDILWHESACNHNRCLRCVLSCEFVPSTVRDHNYYLVWKFVRWGILLFYRLNINCMMQCGADEHAAVIEWIAHTVSDGADLSVQRSELEEFIIAVDQLRADAGSLASCNPLGPMEKTIFWDKLRTSIRPAGPYHINKSFIAIRIEPCCNVIFQLTKRMFMTRMIKKQAMLSGAIAGRGNFYDSAKGGWPCQKSEYDELRQTTVTIPLLESELTGHLSQQRCVFFEKAKWDAIVAASDASATVEVADHTVIDIKSAENDIGNYNFYSAVMDGSWYGFRSALQSTFGKYCGGSNLLYVGSPIADIAVDEGTLAANEIAGFGSIEEIYNFRMIEKFYGYALGDPEKLPPGYTQLAFVTRDAGGDTPIDEDTSSYQGPDDHSPHEDDEQTNQTTRPPPSDEIVGSSPLCDISNKRGQTASGRATLAKTKKRRISMIDDEAEGEDGDEGDEVIYSRPAMHLPFT